MPLADAMTLATVGDDGAPDARMVLLKGHGPDGFRFFTNYESAKAGQIDADPRGALVIYWREHDRQVRARGPFERLPAADSDAYFASRSRESRLGAWASPQTRPLADRAELDAASPRSASASPRSRTSPARRPGAASSSVRGRSSSGRDSRPASTTASSTPARRTAGESSAWLPERPTQVRYDEFKLRHQADGIDAYRAAKERLIRATD